MGFDNKLMKKFRLPWNSFQFFIIANFQEPRNLLSGLSIGYCIISKRNEMFFMISTTRILAFFTKLSIFSNFKHFSSLFRLSSLTEILRWDLIISYWKMFLAMD